MLDELDALEAELADEELGAVEVEKGAIMGHVGKREEIQAPAKQQPAQDEADLLA